MEPQRHIIDKTNLNSNNNNDNDNNRVAGAALVQISSYIADLFWSLFLFLIRKCCWKEYHTGEKEFTVSVLPQEIRWTLSRNWRKSLRTCTPHLHNCKLAMIANQCEVSFSIIPHVVGPDIQL